MSIPEFVHLHQHTTYSAFDGISSVEDIAAAVKSRGMRACAITDHGTFAGAIAFLKACRDKDVQIKPILGMEAYHARNHLCHDKEGQPDGKKGNKHINLIAKNKIGYQNLCTLSQIASTQGYYYNPRIDIDLLEKYKDGLIVTSACPASLINYNLRNDQYDKAKSAASVFKDIFGRDFYLELQWHGLSIEAQILPQAYKIAKELDIGVIATNDVHYINKEDAKFHNIVLALNKKTTVNDPKLKQYPYNEFWLKPPSEMYKMFKTIPSALCNTVVIAEQCDYSDFLLVEDGGPFLLPSLDVPDGFADNHAYLSHLAWDGLKKMGLSDSPKHVERLKMELNDLLVALETKKINFAVYFRMVYDIARYCIERNITFGIRGSAYGSLILRCIGVTRGLDPLEFGLLWERFLAFETLNGKRIYARSGLPDVDIDVDYLYRQEVIDYLKNKYGQENVASIGVVQTLKTKASVRRAVKVLDPTNSVKFDTKGKRIKEEENQSFALENEILDTLPKIMRDKNGEPFDSVEKAADRYLEFRKYMEAYPEVFKVAKRLEGCISAWGVHAAAVAISPIPLSQICPTHYTQEIEAEDNEKKIATQFTMSEVESIGLVKMDILGLSTCTAIDWAVKNIQKSYGELIDLDNLNLLDGETLALVNSGKTDGCFQLNEEGMKQSIREIGCDSIRDIAAVIAMYRPGPMEYISEFANRKKGSSTVQYHHPIMKKITGETYGIIVYQEQLMRVFVELAGLTPSQGYDFQKGCAKKKKHIIEKYKDIFCNACLKRGIQDNTVKAIWADLERFSGYGFNLSHAASYALVAFQTAFLKAHYPTEFIAARLSVETLRRKFELVEKYEYDATHNFGITFLPPDINKSQLGYTIVGDKKLLRPLLVKGVGIEAAKEIISHQPYKGPDILLSFALKVGRSVTTKVVEAMQENGLWGNLSKAKVVGGFEQIKKDKKICRGRPMGAVYT